jgi:hypothetical protein
MIQKFREKKHKAKRKEKILKNDFNGIKYDFRNVLI